MKSNESSFRDREAAIAIAFLADTQFLEHNFYTSKECRQVLLIQARLMNQTHFGHDTRPRDDQIKRSGMLSRDTELSGFTLLEVQRSPENGNWDSHLLVEPIDLNQLVRGVIWVPQLTQSSTGQCH